MTFLVDANVLSEPTRPGPDLRVVAWLRAHERHVVVDPVVLGELRFGVLALPPGRRRDRLEAWFEGSVARVRCLPWDRDTGLRWAELLAQLRRAGTAMPVKDSMIAATALVHGCTVVTRNVRDFEKAGLPILDPFAG